MIFKPRPFRGHDRAYVPQGALLAGGMEVTVCQRR